MARKINAADRLAHDDSWIDDVLDVITKRAHSLKIYVDGEGREHEVTIIYDNAHEEIQIKDEYDNANKPTAFNESLQSFLDEVPSGTKLIVTKTNVGILVDEVIEGKRGLARQTHRQMKDKRIWLDNDRPKRK